MSDPTPAGTAGARAVRVRAAYDAVARAYDAQLRDELDHKPLDRALLLAFLELASSGTVADIGCGPGPVTRFLAARHPAVVGVDLSPGMVAVAREHAPELAFSVGSMLDLPAADDSWSGAVAFYSIIHLTPDERRTAWRELARVLRPGGWLLLAFHVQSADFAPGAVNRLTDWFGQSVELDGYFLDPAQIVAELMPAGFRLQARVDREPLAAVEYPSRHFYLLVELLAPE